MKNDKLSNFRHPSAIAIQSQNFRRSENRLESFLIQKENHRLLKRIDEISKRRNSYTIEYGKK
jgi:hypothetical protein